MKFLHPEILFLLPFGFALGLILRLGLERGFVRTQVWNPKAVFHGSLMRPVIWGIMGLLLVLALARPVWDPQGVESKGLGQKVLFLVDVSQSMLSPDVLPNRLDATKEALLRLIPDLESDQAGVVVFAGTSVVRSPLTRDKAFLSQVIRGINTNLASRGGTLLGDALRQVERSFVTDGSPGTLWLFTDGGDQESFPLEAAKSLGSKGWRILIWGLGTEAGAAVPQRDVTSSLNRELLKSLVEVTPEGAYFEGDPENFPKTYRAHRWNNTTSAVHDRVYQEGSYYILWLIFLLFAFDSVCLRKRRLIP